MTDRFGDSRLPPLFWVKVTEDDRSCWVWAGYRDQDGYGTCQLRHIRWRVHRMSFTFLVAPIPEGLTVDHLCRNRACVRPSHLEAVPNRINVLRGDTLPARNVAKTRCPAGHLLAGANLLTGDLNRGRRGCRTCANDRARSRREAVA